MMHEVDSRLLAELRRGDKKKTAAELSVLVGQNYKVTSRHLHSLQEQGKVVQEEDGRWGLSNTPKPTPPAPKPTPKKRPKAAPRKATGPAPTPPPRPPRMTEVQVEAAVLVALRQSGRIPTRAVDVAGRMGRDLAEVVPALERLAYQKRVRQTRSGRWVAVEVVA